ncbi:MAG: glycosyltransferase [Chloroflexi bacterium]|nr:glycosyltransferase [Chloroflexota bacterium]
MLTKQTRKLNVMHIILSLDVGGAQEVVRTLVEYLAASECVPIVCTFKDGPLRHEIERVGVTVQVLPRRRHGILALPWFVADMVCIWRALKTLINQYHIDVVQTHLLRVFDFMALLLRWTTPVRAVFWTFHSANFVIKKEHLARHKWLLTPKRWAYRCLYVLTARWVDGFVAVSEQIQESLVQEFGPAVASKITVISNGVDVHRYGNERNRKAIRRSLSVPYAAQVLIMVGTLKPVKGHRYMLEALPALVSRCPAVYLVVVGDGELRDVLQAQVAALNLSNHVRFLGNRQDIGDLLVAADVFVLSSLWEGLSMALLEAMASSLPIVATEVSGTTQAIISDETGLLVPPGDATKLAQAIEQLLSNPERARAMGARARQRVETEFGARKQANEHIALYRQLLVKSGN